jgi:hypothetical protein
MKHTIVRYKVKPERAAENEELVRAVYAELNEKRPAGFHYATFKLDDGVSFVHVAWHDADAQSPLPGVQAFQRFQEDIGDRCDERPVASSGTEIGSYRFFGE